MSDLGGDAACWLALVCDGCGAFVEDPDEHRCPADSGEPDRGRGGVAAPGPDGLLSDEAGPR